MGGSGGNDEAKKARQAEEERQKRIREGTARINSIFDGQVSGAGKLRGKTAYDTKAKYYTADGSVWRPKDLPGTKATTKTERVYIPSRGDDDNGGGHWEERVTNVAGTPGKTAAEQFAEMLKGGKLFSGKETKGGFTDDFFKQQRQNYIDYATPQLETQRGDASKELAFALSRAGLTNSSVRAQKEADLKQTYDLNKQQIADQALSYETEARNSVEDARANLISTLNATGDAEGAASAAIARASALSKPQAYSPLSNLFADFTSALGTQAALEKANYYSGGQSGGRYNTGLFSPRSGSVQVT